MKRRNFLSNAAFLTAVPFLSIACQGIARSLLHFPSLMSEEKNILITWLHELIDATLKFNRQDGFFHDIMNDSDSFVETNGGQMMAYAIIYSSKK